MKIAQAKLRICVGVIAILATGPAAADFNGGYIYWPGHIHGGYDFRLNDPSRSDSKIDPIAMAQVFGMLVAGHEKIQLPHAISGDRKVNRLATKLCVAAAEREFDGDVRVTGIKSIDPIGEGYTVRGSMASDYASYRFMCETNGETVTHVTVD